jgi:hypothetical protein
VINRYVLWNKRLPSPALTEESSAVLREAFAESNEEAPHPGLFSQTTGLAIRQHLAETDTGAEVILSMTDGRPTLRLASRVTIADLDLSVRSYNCLRAASIDTLDKLLCWKPAQLMELPNFGRKCLNEITDIVHQLGYPSFGNKVGSTGAQQKLPLVEACAPLACLLQVRELASAGSLPERFVAHGWNSVADLAVHSAEAIVGLAGLGIEEKSQFERALHAFSLELPIELPARFLHNTDALRAAFHVEIVQLKCSLPHGSGETSSWQVSPSSRSLNEELLRLIPKSYGDRKRNIVSDLFGFGSKDPLTLDEVAKAQTPPLTRERVRQVARPITDALSTRGRELPSLLKAIAALERLAPCSLKQAEQALLDDKILDAPMTVAAIFRLARRSYVEHGLLVEGDSLVTPDIAGLVGAVVSAAGKLSSRWGVSDWRQIEPLVPENLRSVIQTQLGQVVWLDGEQRYFVLPGWENSLANRLARILTVTPRLKLAEAYQGAFRDPRLEKGRLPEALFAAFCEVWPWCSVEGNEVFARVGLPPSEVSGDDLLVLLLREIGHPVRRRELTERAVQQGIRPDVVTYALSYSNVIASANGYFAVIGDPRLDDFGSSAASAPSETLEPAIEPEDGDLLPDGSVGLAGPLMLAVQERVAALGLPAPWSLSELRLSQRDRDRLLAWGQHAKWDFRGDFGNFETRSGEKVRKRTARGWPFYCSRRKRSAGLAAPALFGQR